MHPVSPGRPADPHQDVPMKAVAADRDVALGARRAAAVPPAPLNYHRTTLRPGRSPVRAIDEPKSRIDLFMTPNHDHASLFVAPPSPPGAEVADRPQSAVDRGAEAMRCLRHPFAVRGARRPAVAR